MPSGRAPRRRRRWCRPTSTTRGSPSATRRAGRRGARRGSPRSAPDGAVPVKWVVVHAEQVADLAGSPDSSSTSRASATDGCSPWSTPPPGRVHAPGVGGRVAEMPGQQHLVVRARTRGVRREALQPERRWSASASITRPTTGTAPDSTSSSGFQAASTVEPSTSTTRGCGRVGRHPAVVHDAGWRGRRRAARPAASAAGGRCRRERGLADRGVEARSPRAPRGPRRRAGPRRGRRRPRAGSTARRARRAAPAGSAGSRPTAALAEDDGVRRHPLSPRQGSHARQPSEVR